MPESVIDLLTSRAEKALRQRNKWSQWLSRRTFFGSVQWWNRIVVFVVSKKISFKMFLCAVDNDILLE